VREGLGKNKDEQSNKTGKLDNPQRKTKSDKPNSKGQLKGGIRGGGKNKKRRQQNKALANHSQETREG